LVKGGAISGVSITIITSAITTAIITISDAGAKDAGGASLFLPFSCLGGPQQMAISAVEHGIGP
jgi:hypothetical protein